VLYVMGGIGSTGEITDIGRLGGGVALLIAAAVVAARSIPKRARDAKGRPIKDPAGLLTLLQ
jgi:hypothetical protein